MRTLSELEAMSDDDLNKMLAGLLGVKPELVDWMAYKDDGDTGSCCMSGQSEREVQDWIDKLPDGSWAKDYKPKPFYRWPDYCRCLNSCRTVTDQLCASGGILPFLMLLSQVCANAKNDDRIATARQNVIALVLTLQAP